MKYKVGDKVRIIPKKPSWTGALNWNPRMTDHCNEVVTITSCENILDGLQTYYTSAFGGWKWKEDWLLPASKFREHDNVKVKLTGESFVIGENNLYRDEDLELISRKQLI